MFLVLLLPMVRFVYLRLLTTFTSSHAILLDAFILLISLRLLSLSSCVCYDFDVLKTPLPQCGSIKKVGCFVCFGYLSAKPFCYAVSL